MYADEYVTGYWNKVFFFFSSNKASGLQHHDSTHAWILLNCLWPVHHKSHLQWWGCSQTGRKICEQRLAVDEVVWLLYYTPWIVKHLHPAKKYHGSPHSQKPMRDLFPFWYKTAYTRSKALIANLIPNHTLKFNQIRQCALWRNSTKK